MAAVRHFSLSCCLLCALAGMIRAFWPENHCKPVINTVLLLYIVASVIPLARDADWSGLGMELRGWGRTAAADYSAYSAALGRQSAAEALQAKLAQAGIRATVDITDEMCTVTLADPAALERAGPLVAEACGEKLAYTLAVEQGE